MNRWDCDSHYSQPTSLHPLTMLASSTISALLLASSTLATRSVSVSFVDSPATAVDVDNLIVSTRITNTGDETLRLLEEPRSLLTPNWPTETFEIRAGGIKTPFKGVRVCLLHASISPFSIDVGNFYQYSILWNLGQALPKCRSCKQGVPITSPRQFRRPHSLTRRRV